MTTGLFFYSLFALLCECYCCAESRAGFYGTSVAYLQVLCEEGAQLCLQQLPAAQNTSVSKGLSKGEY